jgi:hypothetical protein
MAQFDDSDSNPSSDGESDDPSGKQPEFLEALSDQRKKYFEHYYAVTLATIIARNKQGSLSVTVSLESWNNVWKTALIARLRAEGFLVSETNERAFSGAFYEVPALKIEWDQEKINERKKVEA